MSNFNELKKGPTGRYGLLQAGYWMDYLVIANFAAVFLANRGFSTGEIGIITSVASLLSCVLQQVTGIIADKQDKVPLKFIVMSFIGVCMLAFFLLAILPNALWSTALFYMTALTVQATMSPLLNSLCLQFSNNGYNINFGISRACGSFGYALAGLVMGTIVESFGSEIIVPIYLGIYLLVIILLIFFPVPVKDEKAKIVAGNALLENDEPSNMKQFFHKYHRFLVLMLGFICLWFLNNILGTYMIYFVEYHGGNNTDVGLILAIMAFAEMPAVLFGNNIMKKIGAPMMLRISAIGGVVKGILFVISPNIKFFVLANIVHFFLSGFYQVSAVYYVYSIVGEKDIIKGQTMLGVATTGIVCMLSNYLGGVMLETLSIPLILVIGTGVSVLAAFIIFLATSPNLFKNEIIRKI